MELKCKISLQLKKVKAQKKYKRVKQEQTVNQPLQTTDFGHNRATPLYVITTSNVFLPFTGFALSQTKSLQWKKTKHQSSSVDGLTLILEEVVGKSAF